MPGGRPPHGRRRGHAPLILGQHVWVSEKLGSEAGGGSSRARWWIRLTPQVIAVVVLALVVAGLATMTLNWLLRREPFWSWPTARPVPTTNGWRDALGADPLDLVKVALTVAAGLGGAVALTVSYRKQALAEREEARSLREEDRDQARAYRDRYGAAAAQLGDEDAAVRLAGVYALANLADDWTEQRQQCVDVLCAYLRLPWDPQHDPANPVVTKTVKQTLARTPAKETSTTYGYANQPGEVEVRKTILRVIGDHLRGPQPDPEPGDVADAGPAPGPWSTLQLDFTGATLPDLSFCCVVLADVSFEGAQFTGDAWLKGASFAGYAGFEGARFAGYAGFEGARFAGYAVFEGARFAGDAGFWGASFARYATFGGASFAGDAWFEEASFTGKVSFNEASFTGPAVFNQASFTGPAVFNQASFTGYAVFREASFTGDASFEGVSFTGDARFESRRGVHQVLRTLVIAFPTLGAASNLTLDGQPWPWIGPAQEQGTPLRNEDF